MPITFPQEVGLRDARGVLIRPFAEPDADALHAFFTSLPEDTKRYAWDRIEHREVVDQWIQDLDHESVVSLIALDGARIIADATLHYRRYGPPALRRAREVADRPGVPGRRYRVRPDRQPNDTGFSARR